MRGSLSRVTKLAVSTALACVLVVGPLGLSGASAELESFSSQSTGFALRVNVDILSDLLPDDVPSGVDQYFIRTLTDATDEATEAVAKLGDGSVDLPSVMADNVGEENTHSEGSLDEVPFLSAEAGQLLAKVAEGPVVDAQGTLASVSVGLQGVADELPEAVTDLIDALVDEVNAAVADAEEQLAEVLLEVEHGLVGDESIIGAVCDETEPLTDPLGLPLDLGDLCDDTEENAEEILAAVTGLLNLPELPNPLDTDIAAVEGLVSETLSERSETVVAASSSSSLKSVSVLGGFLAVDAVNLSSSSQAAGTPGSASNEADCSIGDVLLGDEGNGISLDGQRVYVGGEEISIVGDLVAEVKDIVDGLLATAGLSIELCDDAQAEVAEDGTSASQSLSAFVVEFAPVDGIYVLVDPTVQTAVAAQPAVEEAPVQLPRTGAPAALVMFIGAALIGGALAVRRWIR